jgi:hypothetical protein
MKWRTLLGKTGETTYTFIPLTTVHHLSNFQNFIINCLCSLLAVINLILKKKKEKLPRRSRAIHQIPQHYHQAGCKFILCHKARDSEDQLKKIAVGIHRRRLHIHHSCIPRP